MSKLPPLELAALRSVLPQSLFEVVDISNSAGSIEDIDDETKDEIRDRCIEMLDLTGFDHDYNLTPMGEILETLIDKFFIG